MSAFSLSLVNKDPATVETALERIYIPALTLPALLFHKALVSVYSEFAKVMQPEEELKYFVKIDENGFFTEALSIQDHGTISLMISQSTPTVEEIARMKGERQLFQPSYLASVAVMHSLLPQVDRNVCYPHQKVGVLKMATLMLMHIDKTHKYSVLCQPGENFAIQGIGPTFETGPYLLIKTNSWANVTLTNYAKHNSAFHPNAVSEAVH